MNSLKIFNYSETDIRTITIDGIVWFVAKDICDVLELGNVAMTLTRLDEDEKLTSKLLMSGQERKTWLINESGLYSLIFSSNKPEAKKFKKWVTSEVLPTIRQTGSYSLKNLVLGSPIGWERTFPEEFFREVMRIYNKCYHPKVGTPQFVGNFINKYIYQCLDRNMEKELKLARFNYQNSTDEFAFLHQFLKEEGRIPLKSHIISITTLLKVSRDISQFEMAFNRVYVYKNQLEMYLR